MAGGLRPNIQTEGLDEGEFFCKWLHSRLMVQNKNVLGVELGPTGSGKSYRDLRKVELWYEKYLKRPFPVENICFGTLKAMERISSGELKRGDIIIFEEAGVGLGSLDFQSKVSKMFSYVLQSFRSMNIGIFFNLPYLSMLNKSARLLLHYSSVSYGIDHKAKKNKCKLYLHQVNQQTGMVYTKYPRVRTSRGSRPLKLMSYSLPSEYLREAYEKKKEDFLAESTKQFTLKIKEIESKEMVVEAELTDRQKRLIEYAKQGLVQTKIAELEGITQTAISQAYRVLKKKGFDAKKIQKQENLLEVAV